MKNNSSIEDVSFRWRQEKVKIEEDMKGYHDLAPGAPWQDSRQQASVARAPMQDVASSNRSHSTPRKTSHKKLPRSTEPSQYSLSPIPMKSNDSNDGNDSNETQTWRNHYNAGNTKEEEEEEEKEEESESKKGDQVYAKSNELRWTKVVTERGIQQFQMIQHRVHTFQWKMPTSLDNADKTHTTVSGEELARLR